MTERVLQCINGCDGARFEALNAPVIVDGHGRVVGIDLARATYLCALCNGVALDVAAAGREMRADRSRGYEADPVTCPACGTEMLAPQEDPLADLMECPMCGQRFSRDEGTTRVIGGSGPVGDPDLN